LLFKWGVKINIRLFFQVMGVLLLLIVAGLVVSALKHFDGAVASLAQINPQSDLCFYYERFSKEPSCILGPRVWDTSNILPDRRFPGVVLKALFGYREKLYLVQAVAYVVFLLTVGGLYFRSLGGRAITSNRSDQNRGQGSRVRGQGN
jgi:high-affinity iron transporter